MIRSDTSFIRELLRRAAVHAAGEDGAAPIVTQVEVDRALDDLLKRRGALGRRLLGGEQRPDEPGPEAFVMLGE